ncbi:CSEP0433 putative effector protein [Blumeria hordei DH14]|uniref:CSEP0433 putative effector protein n=1 Tax=Blumeria graminis f. sp. hordei (strain DH14) TaxID=546991 RepID=N1JLW9_BLUG1|nr:CSEP0433 putative effector protein [Blumeria hordei DH14]
MVCIVAFLLLVNQEKIAFNRLVLVGNDALESLYNVYEPSSEGFPKPIGDIRMSKVQTKTLGTYQALYCSRSLKSREIAKRLTENLPNLNHRSHYTANFIRPALTECHSHLESLKLGQPEGEILWSSVDRKKCTPELILNLSYHNIVTVTGPFQDFFPVPDSFKIKVKIEEQLNLADLIDNQRIFRNKKWSKNHVVLAWYQGNLQLFQWVDGRYWYPVTSVGAETSNGLKLFYFVLGLDHKIWNLAPHVSIAINRSLESSQWRRHEEKILQYVYQESESLNDNIEIPTGLLTSSPVKGQLYRKFIKR